MNTEIITILAQARAKKNEATENMKAFKAAFESTPEYQALANNLAKATETENLADEQFRRSALILYESDPTNYKKAESYEIKMTAAVTITDEASAIRWSITNFTPALALNRKVFETAVKAGSIPADLATVSEQPKVFIKSDLSDWLAAE